MMAMLKNGKVSECREKLESGLLRHASTIRKKDVIRAKLVELLKNDAYTLSLARYQLLVECGDEQLGTFCKDPQNREMLEALLADRTWLEAFLCSSYLDGRGENALEVLAEIWREESDELVDPLSRQLATGIALAFGVSSRGDNLRERGATPLGRFRYFTKAHQEGRLHRMYDALEAWEMFYLAAATADDRSMPWLLDHINIPLSRYTDACWMTEYRGGTVYGGWVQAKGFYDPWTEAMGNAENTFRHGGVCGALSHYGTQSAAAHGIPAIPMGQPGHCAYGVRFARGDWRGGFGGPYGGAYASPLDRLSKHTDAVFLAEDLFGRWNRNVLSRRCVWMAGLFMDLNSFSSRDGSFGPLPIPESIRNKSKDDEAMVAYRLGLEFQPKNAMTWKDMIRHRGAADKERCEQIAKALAKAFPTHPYVAMELVEDLEKPYMKILESKGADKAEQRAGLVKLWAPIFDAAGEEGWYGWQKTHTWNSCLKRVGENPLARRRFTDMLVYSARDSSALLAAVLGWSQEALTEPSEQIALVNAIGKTLGDDSQGGDAKSRRDFYNKLVLMTESAQSMAAFQSVSLQGESLWDEGDRNQMDQKPPSGFPNPKGKLLSEGGLLVLSSSSRWDRPLLHARLMTPELGFFHTSGEINPWVQLTLPKLGEPSGIIVVPVGGNTGRHLPLQVSVSEDGEQWTKVWETNEMAPFWAIGLKGQRLRVRHVKVERIGEGGDVFHLRGILVFGRDLQ